MVLVRDDLRAWRSASQRIGRERWQTPEQAVAWLGGVQAQDRQWAKWAAGLRTAGCTDEDVERAIASRQIVRTWVFRGTLHLVAAGDVRWLTALVAPGIIRGNAGRFRQLGLDGAVFGRSQELIRQALEAHGPLTRNEIKAHLAREGVPTEGQRMPHLLQRAALDCLICEGTLRGRAPTYALLDDWVGAQPVLERAEALRRLAARYLASHGPATPQDLAWWAGIAVREATEALVAWPGARSLDVEGARYWATGEPPIADEAGSACLLPPFDEYLLGYRERSLVLDPAYLRRVNAGGGMLKPTVMVGGEIAGVWARRSGKQGLVAEIAPFRALGPVERDLVGRAAGRYGAFAGRPVDVQYVPGSAA